MIYTKDNPKLVKCYYDAVKCVKSFTGVAKDQYNDFYYYLNGELHRTDGPAVEHSNGTKLWYLNGQYHREDGPAIEYYHGHKYWFLNDKCYGANDDFTNESWIRFVGLELLK